MRIGATSFVTKKISPTFPSWAYLLCGKPIVSSPFVCLSGALPDNYFSCLGLDGSKLSALIDTISNIDTVDDKKAQ